MTLTCECDHPRKEHDGGKNLCSDYKVAECKHQGCTCKNYRNDEKSRKERNDAMAATMILPIVIVACCAIGYVICHFAIDITFEGYDVTSEVEYKKFVNGEEVELDSLLGTSLSPPKEHLMFMMKELVGMIFFSIAMFGGFVGAICLWESRCKELIKE